MREHGSTPLMLGLVEVSHPLTEQDPCKDSPSHHNPTTFAKQVFPLMTRNLDHAHNEKRPVSPSWKNVRGCVAISVDWALFDQSFTKHVIKNGLINGEWFSSSPMLPVPSNPSKWGHGKTLPDPKRAMNFVIGATGYVAPTRHLPLMVKVAA